MFERQTILIVDDTPQNIGFLSHALEDEYRIKVASNGERAIDIVYSESPPDLVLLDIVMPGLSGYDVCRKIKDNPDRCNIPIIFVSAMSSIEDEAMGLSLGAVDYITKPISPPIVQARVRTHLALYDQTRALERMVRQRTSDLTASRQALITRLGRAAEFKDNARGNHVIRMSHYARLIAEAAGVGPELTAMIFSATPLHDVGKIGIPDAILKNNGTLSSLEWELLHQHPLHGAEIIGEENDSELLALARAIALSHHERWDGTGYPNQLKGEAIPLVARIVSIADAFDALTTPRSYRAEVTVDEAVIRILAEAGRQFDPQLMEAFQSALPKLIEIKERYADEKGTLSDIHSGKGLASVRA